jgi:hypothetical protein
MCAIISMLVLGSLLMTDPDRLHGVEGYHHSNLTPIQARDHGQSAMLDHSVPVVAKTEECVV